MTLSERKKKILREYVDFTCEQCNKTEAEVGVLEIHRINRGNNGGEYTLNNLKILCKECHKLIHFNEFR